VSAGIGTERSRKVPSEVEVVPLSRFTPDAALAVGGPSWLVARRAAAAERLQAQSMPSEAEEIWRYSGIDTFDLDRFAPSLAPGDVAVAAALATARSAAVSFGAHAALVVTLDGRVVAIQGPGSGTGVDSAGVGGAGVGGAGVDGDGSGSLQVYAAAAAAVPPTALGAVAVGGDAFDELHDAFLCDAAVVDVAAGSDVGHPVLVIHLVRGDAVGARGGAVFPRTVVRLGEGARAGVVELILPAAAAAAGAGGGARDGLAAATGTGLGPLVVSVAELEVADGASLAYANLQELDHSATQVAVQASRVGTDGELRSFSAVAGGGYARLRTDATVAGSGARSTLLAAYLGTGDQVLDFRTRQVHAAPRTHSELLFKGAVADTARSVYSGLIRIRRGARGSDALQTNHNLVLSEGARADSVPNLDIEENDVRCSHASTVGPIDEDQRYYLESRGIEPTVAERLVVAGFFTDLAARAPFDGVGRRLQALVGEQLIARTPSATAGAGRG
jgi:Fe-S cluster assembly protein SufD